MLYSAALCINIFTIPQIFPTGRPNLTTDEMRDKQMDFGILTMIILDFEPFNFVSR